MLLKDCDPEQMYRHIRLGLILVSGSDLNTMSHDIGALGSELNPEDAQLLRDKWDLVRVRLEEEGFI